MKKLALITLTTLALLGTQPTKATDLSKDEYITQLETKIQRLEEQQFTLPQDLSDDTVDYYAAYQIIKAYNGLEYDENITWTVNENSITIELNN
nr:MAG TPA: zipper dimerization domain transcription factor-like protein [Caudoviricetes sp.]